MDTDIPTGPPPAHSRGEQTFYQVAKGLDVSHEGIPGFQEALDAFRQFLVSQEADRLSKHQLRLLRSQAVSVFEECAAYRNSGGDPSAILPIVTEVLTGLSEELERGPRWDEAIADPSVMRRLESTIGDAVDRLEDQMRTMAKVDDVEMMYKNELERAREGDRRKLEELESAIRELKSPAHHTPKEVVQSLVEENLKIIGHSSATFEQKQIDARKVLAVIAELTGESLPPSTILDKRFVIIGGHAINKGSSYDVFAGEYFTGEKIAIKVLRHRVDEATARRTHARFARLTENWAALRHDSILPFYGIGVMPSPVSPAEYQLYLVSPYLRNQDVKRYIKTYPNVPKRARLQMVLDVARGLKYMHDGDDLQGVEGGGMVHSALNIYNVLVKDSGRAVISGLGHAKVIKDFQAGASFTGDNSEYRYMGPEILDDAVLTFGSDIWSWAMTSLEILTDEPPFGAKTRGTKIIQMIGANQRPERSNHPKLEEYEYSDEIWQLFEDCWHRKPEARPSARQVVQRVKPFGRELGKKEQHNEQKLPPPTYPRTEYGWSDLIIVQGTKHHPEPNQLGRATRPIAHGQPPSSGTGGTTGKGNQDGKVSNPVAPAPDQSDLTSDYLSSKSSRDPYVTSVDNPGQGIRTGVIAAKASAYSRGSVTFAHLLSELSKLVKIGSDLRDALQAFQIFLEVEENATIGRDQLRVLRAQAVYVLEEYARFRSKGGSLEQVLSAFIQAMYNISGEIKFIGRWDAFVKEKVGLSKVEVAVNGAFETLAKQLEKLINYQGLNPLLCNHDSDLEKARESDRNKVVMIKTAARDNRYKGPPFCNLDTGATLLVDHCLALMRSPAATGQQITDLKLTLAAIAELSGASVPPFTLVNERSIETRTHFISRSANFDVFVGEYFTGQEVVIKLTKLKLDKENAIVTRSRFAQLRENWTSLRHDCIQPLYGLGITPPLGLSPEYRLYFVSPFLRNRDVSTYLQMYPQTSESSRLRMVLDIARGLNYMHFEYLLPDGKGVAHHALNVYNVLVKDSGRAVISGFGHADILKYVSPKDRDFESYRYTGPEFLSSAVSRFSFGSDIWSWAMTSLEILTGEPPFGSNIKGAGIIQELRTRHPNRASHSKLECYEYRDEIWKLLEGCWQRSPEDRPSANEIVQRFRPLVNKPISRDMSVTGILRLLAENGYPKTSTEINQGRCSSTAINGGGGGDIYLGYLTNGLKVAIKCPRSLNSREEGGRKALKASRFIRFPAIVKEGYQWSKHQHENILEIFGFALFREQIALVSPWMENGTVLNYVRKHSEVDRIKLCWQVAKGLAYLHNAGTVHGDLKAINVLVCQDGIAKIIDFGSTVMNHYSLKFTGEENDYRFTMRWTAPELLQENETSVGKPNKPTKPSDVYAFSMTILEIVTGKPPFEHIKTETAVCMAICRNKRPRRPMDKIPTSSSDGDKLWNLLERCWQLGPDDRPIVQDVELALSEITQEGLKAN